jgi:eukaryotic-like serine/threonine-protein kinase
MSGDRTDAGDTCGLEQARQIHAVCEEFETRWRAGDRLALEDLVGRVEPSSRPALLEELLMLELELRRGAGEYPALAEYRSRFPDQVDRVDAAFAHAAAASRPASEIETVCDRSGSTDVSDASAVMGPISGRVGDYDVLEEIARGGMGVVYKAKQRKAKRLVALKMILSGQMASPDERERFLREAELAANLDHQHIVPIYEVAEFHGCPFFSMKLIEGESLSHQIKAKKRAGVLHDPQTAARLMATIARAVQYAHERGFLHCDLKPSNILLDREGRPYVTDFGLAKRASENSAVSMSGAIMGTPSYMAPEQASGARLALRPTTDVYGLGAIFYELLTARPPLQADSVPETVVAVLERDPTPPRDLRPEVPAELETICLKCLEKSPQNRYETAGALADELDRYLRGEVIDATTLIPRLRRWNRREPELVARLGGLLLVALIAQFNYYILSEKPDFWHHCTIQGVLALWAASAVIFQAMLRSGWHADQVRVLWSAADIAFLTLELKLFEEILSGSLGHREVHVETTLLVGYPLLIAASGLWWRVRLVWITTALAMAAYVWLYVDAALRWRAGHLIWDPSPDLRHPNIFLAALFLTGYVVARQVRRILLLSQYYENRQGA